MTLVQLEYIVALDTYRHFITASEKSFVTQPTLSMQVQKLEEELGMKIFDRSKKPLVPTQAGAEVIAQARRILQEAARMKQLVSASKGEVEGDLRVGIIPTVAPYLLPLFINKFLHRYPKVKLTVSEQTTAEIIQNLKKGLIDAAVLVTPLNDPSINEHPMFYEKLLVYVSKEEKLFRKKYILAKDIEPDKLWLLEEGHCMRSQIVNLCELKKKSRSHGNFEYEAGSIETLKKMVERNGGITILPELATLDMHASQKKMIREFAAPTPVREVSLVTHRDYIKKNLIDAFRSEIVNIIPEGFEKSKKQRVIDIDI
jgi:LysR family hydrogen peroxide-inducible transcriptional activator